MAATTSQLLTVDDFRRLPEDDGSVYHELRHGELGPVTRPKFKHFRIQKQLEKLLEAAGGCFQAYTARIGRSRSYNP